MTMPNKGKKLLIWKGHVTMTKIDAYINNEMQTKIIPQLSFTKTNHFFQLPALCLVHPYLKRLLLPWTS